MRYKLNLPIWQGSKVKGSHENQEGIYIKKIKEKVRNQMPGAVCSGSCWMQMGHDIATAVTSAGCVRSLTWIGLLTYWWFAQSPDNAHHYVNICHLNSCYVHLLSLAVVATVRKSHLVFRKYWTMNFKVAKCKKFIKKIESKMHGEVWWNKFGMTDNKSSNKSSLYLERFMRKHISNFIPKTKGNNT